MFDECLDRRISMKGLSQNGSLINGFVKLFSTFLEALKSFEGCERFIEKISKWDMVKLANSWTKVVEPMKMGFVVLTHGDPWVNNILLSSSDALFIDYQMSFWGSPSADLIYFFITSIADDVKTQKFDEFIEFYHKELVKALKKLEYYKDIPTLNELHEDVLEKGTFGEMF